MQKTQYAECSRSVSEGDLVGGDKNKQKHVSCREELSKSSDKQVFFTLPRWISSRKKRSKIKYVKIDVPFSGGEEKAPKSASNTLPREKNVEKPNTSFIRRLFRSNSFFSNSNSKILNKPVLKSPNSPPFFYSHSDVRSSSAFNFNSFECQEYFKNKCLAVMGIKNHGNTCFMNAVIQCLSNTDTFAEYFVMDHYKMDLARRNKTHSKRYGTRGEVTEQLGALLKSLWSCQYYGHISNKFKMLVAKYGAQYEGNEQHDAQEFLLWLLDKVHEDLNTAPKEKYKKTKSLLGRTDEEIAAEMLINHLRCNSSFIHDLFQGQFRSSLCCQGCGRFSNTFDPYLCISLPIPQTYTIPVFLNIVYLKEPVKVTKVGVLIDSQANVIDLREKLNIQFKTAKENILLLEVKDGEFQRTFCDTDLVADFKDSENLYAVETPTKSPNTSMESENILLVMVNKLKSECKCQMIWRPFIVEVSREASFKEMENQISKAMSPVFGEIFDKEMKDLCSFNVVNGEPISETICSSVDMPLYMPAIDKALLICIDYTPHIKLSIDWKPDTREIFTDDLDFVEEHYSVSELMNSTKQPNDVTLDDCFELYFNEEKLGNEDAWNCSYCHHRLPCVKTLSLWTIPDVLIVHLKRFRQLSSQRMKITTDVQFPHSGLDMNPYIATRNQNAQQVLNNSFSSLAFWSPWKRSRYHSYSRTDDNMYELYAVCNHHGSMQGGHYTAYCRNPVNGQWYHFDDTSVKAVQVSKVVSSDAYILFYQRSSLMSHSCASSSSSGYSSASSTYSVGLDHWAFHMASFFRDFPVASKSSDSLYDAGKTSSLDRRQMSPHRAFDRSMRKYSTLSQCSIKKPIVINQDSIDSGKPEQEVEIPKKEVIPPPPPPVKHYWTVTSV